jgi:hypothetical protein
METRLLPFLANTGTYPGFLSLFLRKKSNQKTVRKQLQPFSEMPRLNNAATVSSADHLDGTTSDLAFKHYHRHRQWFF